MWKKCYWKTEDMQMNSAWRSKEKSPCGEVAQVEEHLHCSREEGKKRNRQAVFWQDRGRG
jgi:hypothetical protein